MKRALVIATPWKSYQTRGNTITHP